MRKKNKRGKEIFIVIVLSLFILFLLGGFLYTTFYEKKIKKNAIKKNKIILQGAIVTKINLAPRSYEVYIVDFIFKAGGEEYEGEIKNSYAFKRSASFEGRSFPIVCEKGNLKNAFVLIKPEDFEYFEIPFPDSLNWVKQELLK